MAIHLGESFENARSEHSIVSLRWVGTQSTAERLALSRVLVTYHVLLLVELPNKLAQLPIIEAYDGEVVQQRLMLLVKGDEGLLHSLRLRGCHLSQLLLL